jgi:hypothetical protein
MLAGPGVTLTNITFAKGRNDLESPGLANSVVVYEADVSGDSYTSSGCVFIGGPLKNYTGFSQHGAAGQLFASVTHVSPSFTQMAECWSVTAIETTVTGATFADCEAACSLGTSGAALTLSDSEGEVNRLFEALQPSTVNVSDCAFSVPLLGGNSVGFCRVNSVSGDVALTMTDTSIDIVDGPSINSQLIRHQRGSINMSGVKITPAMCNRMIHAVYAGFSGGIAAFSGSGNVYPYGSQFHLNGTDYSTFDAWKSAVDDAGSSVAEIPEPKAVDRFIRPDENLETRDWVRVGGAAGQAAVRSNNLSCIGTTQTFYRLREMLSADHYIRFRPAVAAGSGGPLVVLRCIDKDNFIGIRWSTTQWQIWRFISGNGPSQFATNSTVPPAIGQDVVLAVRGDDLWLYVDGRTLLNGNAMSAAALADARGVGVISRSGVVDPFIQDFSCGRLE